MQKIGTTHHHNFRVHPKTLSASKKCSATLKSRSGLLSPFSNGWRWKPCGISIRTTPDGIWKKWTKAPPQFTKPEGRAEDKARDLLLRSRRAHAYGRQCNKTMATEAQRALFVGVRPAPVVTSFQLVQAPKPEARGHRGDMLPACHYQP